MKIDLGNENFATIDEADAGIVSGHRWYLLRAAGGHLYAQAVVNGKTVLMHRLIMGASSGRVDHRNNDGLDNRRENLRHCSQSQNIAWSRIDKSGCASRFRGVVRRDGWWVARIKVGGKRSQVGKFATEMEAARAYDFAAKAAFGEFARLNIS
jgi:hypothetical protein